MIIDIGSGHKPHQKADVLLEYKGGSNEERWHQNLVTDRPTVLYNGHIFPFKDKSFTSSICRHVLEHVDNPDIFLKEIERISEAGYIETPSEIAELIFTPYDKHKWIIFKSKNKILIKEKTKENTSKLGALFDYLCENEKEFENSFYWSRRKLFFVEINWKDTINFEIIPNSPDTFFNLYDKKILNEITQKNKHINNKKTFKKRKIDEVYAFLEKNLICPLCSKNLIFLSTNFYCRHCNYQYIIENNVIKMYRED
ncbi:class I SAM-dependent methyltransferase [Candidatus Gracilibacteria bacterium]|nr:class I SAM-dependent methyltransferase [Candidatus Gracilibacteria bacterium]